MAPYAGLAIPARRRVDDVTQRVYNNPDLAQAFAEAAHWVQGELGILQNRTSLSLVANQRRYALASTIHKPTDITYWQGSTGHTVESVTDDEFRQWSKNIVRKTIPERYTFLETERVVLLDPIPDTAASATQLDGAITASSATITVDSTTGFATEGILIIESEVIYYTNTTSTTFTGCRRGQEGTTAAAHSDNTAVTERDLTIWAARKYGDMEMRRYYTTSTVTVSNGSATVTAAGGDWRNQIGAGDFFGISGDTTSTAPTIWYEVSSITDATNLELTETYKEPSGASNNYIITSPNPFPNYCDGILIAYATSQLLKRAGKLDQANIEYATARNLLESVRGNALKNDTRYVAKSMREAYRRGRPMPVWVGDVLIG